MDASLMKVYLIILFLSSFLFLDISIDLLKSIGLTSLTSLFLFLSSQFVLTVTVWFLIHFLYHYYYRDDRVHVVVKSVLITGCDSGFGHETAIRLDSLNFKVFAACLDAQGPSAEKLKATCSKFLEVLQLDLTDDYQINEVVEHIKKSNFELWAVVNNAGVMYNSFVEFGSGIDDCQQQFDVNVFGPLKLTKALLPLLRKARGRVVNVTSLAAQFNFPFLGIYTATKHAVRAMTNALRDELEPFAMKVVSIEPTGYFTELANAMSSQFNRMHDETDPAIVEEYVKVYGGDLKAGFESVRKQMIVLARRNLNEVVDAIEKGVLCLEPKNCYRVDGWVLRPVYWLFTMLPDEITSLLNRKMLHSSFKINSNRG